MLKRKRSADDFAQEIQAHLELETDELKAEGLSEDEARRRACIAFGNAGLARERFNLRGRVLWLDNLARDIRFSLRQLRTDPGFAIAAMLMLALGIGASLAIFAFVDAALVQPLPYPRPDRLVDVTESLALYPRGWLSYPDYLDWKRMNTVFSSLEAYSQNYSLFQTVGGRAVPVASLQVSTGFFSTLGVTPILGRGFRPGEDAVSAPATALLSYGAWQRRFGGQRGVIGQAVKLDGVPTTIIGVLPQSFVFAPGGDAEFFAALQPTSECEKRRSCHNLRGFGRLKDGVTVAAAFQNMKAVAGELEREYPDSNRGQGASVMPLATAITGEIRPILLALLSGAGLLLLIACVNVSSLLLIRAEKRRREMAVRGALGASRARLVRQLASEGLVLVLAGSALGLLLADQAMHVLRGMISKGMVAGMPYLHGMGLTPHIWLLAGALALAAEALFVLAPILRLPHADLRGSLSNGARGAAGTLWKRLGGRLVIVEVAVAVVLLAGAGLLAKSFWRLLHVDLGFAPDHLATMQVGLPRAGFDKDEEQVEFVNAMLERVRHQPGVVSAAVTTVLPVSCNCNTDWVRFVGQPYNGVHNEVNEREISTDFFTTLQAQLVRGRLFNVADDGHHPKVIVINQSFAEKYFPGQDPIGHLVGDTDLTPNSLRRIVGVVANIKDGALDEAEWPTEYEPFAQFPDTSFSLLVRTRQDAESTLPELAATVRRLDPDVGVEDEISLAQRIRESPSAWLHRSAAFLVGGFAALAFLLSIVGLYGVIAYSVSQRTREIGVRMALGAQKSTVERMILREAAWLTVAGIALGLGCSIGAAKFIHSLLFGVRAWDVPTLAGVAVLLAAAALAASSIPARRAASVNPAEALRSE